MNNHSHDTAGVISQFIFALPLVMALGFYVFAVILTGRRYKKQWPIYRIAFWILGILCATAAVIGPLAERAYDNFTAHMVSHLLLGMLAPLFLVFAAPMTLILRTLHVTHARRLYRILKSWPIRILSHPVFALTINVGGLWLLYTTNLFMMMQQNIFLHILIHAHVFIAGYLFTMSIIYIDPIPHRTSFYFRAIVLLVALTTHGILSKYIYAHPPNGVSTVQAETGGMIMYYGGDAIEAVLIFILFYQWFKATRPRVSGAPSKQPITL
ncbi:cytochrome c oxidase assembly protein [Paenisporosarcina sp. TG-14]|uniref:cytochrome c oxidase assembly protein n=1 Tax=Paenisporosarcina sp. TG-14 TaxID=1231057 RepID=UPI0002ECB4EA|nr:cytochrome c oxidase assembly protein [Paenisporosarcina sp. TG-14]